ncbi:MAG: hypothetical protein B7X01_03535 [Acidiphilium sp. 21-62-4]|nr:MAG: hypothetical protein B7X01_03535 [Acidiphilium sp. 21-62-4]
MIAEFFLEQIDQPAPMIALLGRHLDRREHPQRRIELEADASVVVRAHAAARQMRGEFGIEARMLGRQPRRRLAKRSVATRRFLGVLALTGDPLREALLDGNRALLGDELGRMAEALDRHDARHLLREERRIAQPDVAAEIALVREALDRLPPKMKETILLFDVADLSLEEIRKIQGGTLSGVKSRLKRGREELRFMLGIETKVIARHNSGRNRNNRTDQSNHVNREAMETYAL